MFANNKVRLFWWNERIFHNSETENYGDLLSKYIVEKVSGKEVKWTNPKQFSLFKKPVYFAIGSILTHVKENCVVWGSGIISKSLEVKKAKFIAVRGPQTRKYLMSKGYDVPEVYGDPALLLPLFFNPKPAKTYKYGIIPHKEDYDLVMNQFSNQENVRVINLSTNDIEKTTLEVLECEKIISSSLHGIIVAHAYGIPAVWQKFSNNLFGDDIKFQDYFESVNIKPYKPEIISIDFLFNTLHLLNDQFSETPNSKVITKLQEGLLKTAPF